MHSPQPSRSRSASISESSGELSLDGDGGYIHLRSQSAKTLSFPGRNPFTIDLLVKPSRADVPIVGKFNTKVSGEWKLYIDVQRRICAYREAPPYELLCSSSAVDLNVWSHICVLYDGHHLVIVHNGREVARCESAECRGDPSTSVHIGTWRVSGEIGSCFVGSLKELRFWSRALSIAELVAYTSDFDFPAGAGVVEGTEDDGAVAINLSQCDLDVADVSTTASAAPSHRRITSLQGEAFSGGGGGGHSDRRRGSSLTAAMLQRLKGAESGLIAYFPMTEGSGRTICDRLDATMSGFLISDTSGWVDRGFVGEGRAESSREALHFDGQSGFVQLPSTAHTLSFLKRKPFTIEAWICPDRADVPIIGKFNSHVRGEYKLWIDADSRLAFYREAEPREIVRSRCAIALSVFSHVAAVYDGETIKLFVNAQEQASAASGECDAIGDVTVATTVQIGTWKRHGKIGSSFYGLMREIRIWGIARTREELRQFMVVPLRIGREKGTGTAIRIRPDPTSPSARGEGEGEEEENSSASDWRDPHVAQHLKAYWPLRASAGSGKRYVVDKSTGGNHGYLMGGVGWVTMEPTRDSDAVGSPTSGGSPPPSLGCSPLGSPLGSGSTSPRSGSTSPRGFRRRLQRVLVTGGAGYIGSHICLELLQRGYLVSVIDNYDNSCAESLRRVVEIAGRPISYHRVDLLDVRAVEAIFEGPAFDAVIHCAGLKSVNESVAQPLHYYHNNITGTINLLQIMQRFDCRNLIFSSSATVYGLPKSVPVREDASHGPTNPYGQTKDMIEQMLTDLFKSDARWNIIMLRYFNPVGAHQSGVIGEDPNGTPSNLLPYITQVAVGRRSHLSVYGDDYDTRDGTGVRDFIHVVDLARGHVASLNRLFAVDGAEERDAVDADADAAAVAASSDGGIGSCGLRVYNLGTGTAYSVLEMLKAMERACGREIPYHISPRRPGDVGEVYSDCSLAESELWLLTETEERVPWTALYGIDDICQDAWRWQQMFPRGYDAAPKV